MVGERHRRQLAGGPEIVRNPLAAQHAPAMFFDEPCDESARFGEPRPDDAASLEQRASQIGRQRGDRRAAAAPPARRAAPPFAVGRGSTAAPTAHAQRTGGRKSRDDFLNTGVCQREITRWVRVDAAIEETSAPDTASTARSHRPAASAPIDGVGHGATGFRTALRSGW